MSRQENDKIFCTNGEVDVGLEKILNMGVVGWSESVPRLSAHMLGASIAGMTHVTFPQQAGYKMVEQILLRY